MWSLETSGLFSERSRKRLGSVLHVVATQLFVLFIALLFLIWMEVWKGVELLHKIHNAWFTFGGARELLGYAVVVFVVGRLVDVYAKRLNPHYKHNPERGWHYRH